MFFPIDRIYPVSLQAHKQISGAPSYTKVLALPDGVSRPQFAMPTLTSVGGLHHDVITVLPFQAQVTVLT